MRERYNEISKKYINVFILAVISVVMSYLGASAYLEIAYKVSLVVYILYGGIFFLTIIIFRKYEKNFTLLLVFCFALFNIITVLLNGNKVSNALVLCSSIIFFSFFINRDEINKDDMQKFLMKIFIIQVAFSFIHAIIAIVMLIFNIQVKCQRPSGDTIILGYIFRGGKMFQLEGLSGVTSLSAMAMVSFLVTIFLIIYFKKYIINNQVMRYILNIFLYFNLVLEFVVLSFTNNLSAIISLSVAVVILVFCCINTIFKSKTSLNYIIIFFISIMLSICVGFLFFYVESNIDKVLFSLKTIDSQSISLQDDMTEDTNSDRDLNEAFTTGTGRTEIWQKAINLWEKKPILGCGYKNMSLTSRFGTEYGNMHNGFLNVLVANGALGFICIVLLFITCGIKILKYLFVGNQSDAFSKVVIALLAAFITYNMVQSYLILERGIVSINLWISLGWLVNYMGVDEYNYKNK